MNTQVQRAVDFLELHRPGAPLLLANPWDAGSAKLFASLGFSALATTSHGFSFSVGQPDFSLDRGRVVAHLADVVAATDLPVTADLENGLGAEPSDVAETVAAALATGIAGCSVEDHQSDPAEPIYPIAQAVERVAAAAEVAHGGDVHLVLTARSDNFLHGRPDLDDTIRRLQAFERAGADVLYAPGLVAIEDIAAVVSAVGLPVNVLTLPGGPTVAQAAGVGVARISVGSAFCLVAAAAAAGAGRELLEDGTLGFWGPAASGMQRVGLALEVRGAAPVA